MILQSHATQQSALDTLDLLNNDLVLKVGLRRKQDYREACYCVLNIDGSRGLTSRKLFQPGLYIHSL